MHNVLLTITSLVAAEAETHGASSGGIGAIGINGKALLFQVINFAILLWILKRVAYKPILKALEDRRKTIEESLRTAKEMERAKEDSAQAQEKLLAQARSEADKVLARAQAEANDRLAETEAKIKKRTEQIVSDAQTRIGEDVKKAKSDLKKETLGLVIAATEAIIEERLDPEKDAQLLERALAQGGKHE